MATTVEQENPLVEGLERLPVHPTTLIIFGGTGDLAQRKLLPAVYNLAHEGALPERFNLIGIARRDIPHDDFRDFARDAIQKYSRRHPDETVLNSLLDRMRYVGGSFDDPAAYDEVARLAGDESFEIYPRKGEFLVFEPPGGDRLERILLPVPAKRTKGVLVFLTLDGKVVAGPTAVDTDDKDDWSVRPDAAGEILPKAWAMLPALEGAQPVASYAGLRPAGRGVNYVVRPSRVCEGLVNVAAIRSTGLSASLGISERVVELVRALSVALGPERPLEPGVPEALGRPWWRVVAEHRAR